MEDQKGKIAFVDDRCIPGTAGECFNQPVELRALRYQIDGSPAIELVTIGEDDGEETWCTPTVFLKDRPLTEPDMVWIRADNENTGIADLLARNDVIEPMPVDFAGRMMAYRLTPKVMELLATVPMPDATKKPKAPGMGQ